MCMQIYECMCTHIHTHEKRIRCVCMCVCIIANIPFVIDCCPLSQPTSIFISSRVPTRKRSSPSALWTVDIPPLEEGAGESHWAFPWFSSLSSQAHVSSSVPILHGLKATWGAGWWSSSEGRVPSAWLCGSHCQCWVKRFRRSCFGVPHALHAPWGHS